MEEKKESSLLPFDGVIDRPHFYPQLEVENVDHQSCSSSSEDEFSLMYQELKEEEAQQDKEENAELRKAIRRDWIMVPGVKRKSYKVELK